MYTEHFGLEKLPFENVPDPVFFFNEGDYHRVRSRITESLKAGRGLIVVTGPIGSGKTTLSQMIKTDFPSDIKLIWIAEPPVNSLDLFLFIAQELGLKPLSSERTFVIRDIREALLKINSEGNRCLVVMDESHLMSDDMINGIRLLNNLEDGSSKLIQILLLGQEELMDIIKRPEMESFRQRIASLEIIGQMNIDGIRKYIFHRIHVAGGQPSLFTDTGWEAIALAFASGNTPRTINSLCDRSLSVAFERKKEAVDLDDVYEAAQSMGLQKDIFFYRLALKQGKNDTAEQADKDKIVTDSDHKKVKPGIIRPVQKLPGIYEESQRSLKTPLLFLVLSIITLIFSIFFYCDRAASPDLITCLQELIGF